MSDTRTVLRIVAETEAGLRVADCAPLPGFHAESLDLCLTALKAYASGDVSPALLPTSLITTLEILEWDSSAYAIRPNHGQFENVALLTVPKDPREFDAAIAQVREARVCKVKVPADDRDESRVFLKALAGDRADRELRVDCNQAMEGQSFASLETLLRDLPIAFVEEPFQDVASLKEFAAEFPLALDESLGLDEELDALAKAWVIKPNSHGLLESLRRFEDGGPQLKILSNAFESPLSLQFYAWVYAKAAVAPQACGFGTAFYLTGSVQAGLWSARKWSGDWPQSPFPHDGKANLDGAEMLWEQV